MKTIISILIYVALIGTALVGCGATAKEIQIKSQSGRADVFTEIKTGETIPEGFAILMITANIKTLLAGYHILESEKSFHEKPGYPFLVNIDGQAALWKVDGVKDNKPAYDADGKTSRDPEAREGMKYVLEKKIRLRPGVHHLFFGLPEENYSTTVDIELKDGETSFIEYKPIYRYKTHPLRIPTFLKGINRYEIFLNGTQIR